MLISRIVVCMFLGGMMVLGAGGVSGQDYPSKPIRILTSGAGGASDILARLIAQGISAPLGQPVIVDNRVAIIAIETVAKAPPDGYSLLFYGTLIWLAPFLRDNVPWDPVRDFSPITLVTSEPNVLVAHPSLPVRSVKELIALAKARPGALNYGSSGSGSSGHLAGELFKSMAGVDIVRIPFKSIVLGLPDLMSGQLQLMFPPVGPVDAHIKSGRLRALAVTSAQPSALVPGLPTLAASGLPGYEVVALNGIFAPGKTPAAIVNRLNQEMVRVLTRADVKEKFLSTGQEIVGSSPEEFAAAIKSDMARMGKVIRDAGIRDD